MKKQKMVCKYCGSEEVSAKATVIWDMDKQKWEVEEIIDGGAFCDPCDRLTSIITKKEYLEQQSKLMEG